MSEYEFTQDWFSHVAPIWRSMIADIKPRKALEIGAFEGFSSVFFLEQAAPFGGLDLTCVDSWQGGVEHAALAMRDVEARFDRNIARAQARHGGTVRKIKSDSLGALAGLIAQGASESFDFAYIDGSHQAPDVLGDAVLAFRLLRVGGVLGFDDYLWHMEPDGRQDLLNMPKLAIDAFINTHYRKIKVIHDAPLRQIYLAKIAS